MSADHHQHARLISWLEDQGHSDEEITKILAKVDQYDARTMHESVFEAIARGEIDLGAIIQEALEELPEES